MGKRNLTRRQEWRIKKIQEERASRLSGKAQHIDQQVTKIYKDDSLGPEQKGLVIAHYGSQLAIESLDGKTKGELVRCHFRSNLQSLVAGDEVVWRAGNDGTGIIVAALDRRSELCRPDSNGVTRPVAANIDYIIIVVAPQPAPSSNLIDRYLVAAELQGIEPIILLNKEDLISDDGISTAGVAESIATEDVSIENTSSDNSDAINEKNRIDSLLKLYQSIGYKVLRSSTHSDNGMAELMKLLDDGSYIFAGQSGVGKSSLINALLPDINQKVSSLSSSTGQGVHTTTTAYLFHISGGGKLIDSPGIREFGLWQVAPASIAEGFIDFHPYLGHCKFRNCTHKHEPGCAILAAVADGKIAQQRVDNYFSIINSISNP